jgi:serine/threonine protein kinase/Leucine-rich repeat (LRR) protein
MSDDDSISTLPGNSDSSEPAPPRRIVPRSVAHYQVVGELGSGAFGTVYRALDTKLQREVALKVPTPRSMSSQVARERFLREARAAAQLNHPNICPIYEVGQADGVPFYSMALVRGGSLRKVMQKGRSLPERTVCVLVRKLALALAEAHRVGIVHRDLKPENVLIDEKGQPIIGDFGLAKDFHRHQESLTQDGAVVGTPAYMSPEQLRGQEATIASDIFSLGVIFYELLCGRRPFEGFGSDMLNRIARSDVVPPSPCVYRNDLSAEAAAICLRCLDKDVSRRFGSMDELAAQLRSLITIDGATAIASTPGPGAADARLEALVSSLEATESTIRKRSISTSMWMSSLAVTTLVILLGVFALFRSEYGQVRFQLNLDVSDPSIAVLIDGKTIPVRELQGEIELPLGEHELIVYRAGKEIQRLSFQVGRGTTTVRDSVGPIPDEPTNPDAAIVDQLLERGALLTLIDGSDSAIHLPSLDASTVPSLRSNSWRLTQVAFPEDTLPDDQVIGLLVDAAHLQRLDIANASAMTGASLQELASLKHFGELRLGRWKSTLDALSSWNSLRSLQLDQITCDASELQRLGSLSQLERLSIQNSPIGVEVLPNQLAPRLKVLDAAGTPTSDAAGAWIQSHADLVELDLSRTQISGDLLTSDDLPKSLERMILRETELTDADLGALPPLTGLTHLDVTATYVTADGASRSMSQRPGLTIVRSEPEYRSLSAEVGRLVTAIGGQVQFEVRDPTDQAPRTNQVDDPVLVSAVVAGTLEPLQRLWPLLGRTTSLRSLDLSNAPIGDGQLASLRFLDRLESLVLAGTNVSDHGLSQLRELRSLQSLDARQTDIGGAGLNELQTLSLRRLLLGIPRHTTIDLTSIHQLDKLRHLELSEIPLKALLDGLAKPLSGLEGLACARASGDDLAKLVSWESLVELKLAGSSLRDEDLDILSRLANLSALDLSHTGINGETLSKLHGLPLRLLKLNGNPLTGGGVLNLPGFRQLEELELRGTAADNASLAALSRIKSLKRLDVTDAWTTPTTRAKFRSFRPDCELLPQDPARDDRREQEVATFVLTNGGSVQMIRPDGSTMTADSVDALPAVGTFMLVGIDLSVSVDGMTDDQMRSLAGASSLKRLTLHGPRCSDAALAQLQDMTHLQELTLDSIPFTDRGARYLLACPQLQVLKINEAELTDESLEVIGQLRQLETLQLNHCGVSEQVVATAAALPELRLLDISFPLGTQARNLTRCRSLEHLVLTRCNQLSEGDVIELGRVKSLRQLTIRQCRLSDSCKRRLGGLVAISRLTLEDVNMEAADFRSLKNLRALRSLGLDNMVVELDAAQAIGGIDQLTLLSLRGCSLSPESRTILERSFVGRTLRISDDQVE